MCRPGCALGDGPVFQVDQLVDPLASQLHSGALLLQPLAHVDQVAQAMVGGTGRVGAIGQSVAERFHLFQAASRGGRLRAGRNQPIAELVDGVDRLVAVDGVELACDQPGLQRFNRAQHLGGFVHAP